MEQKLPSGIALLLIAILIGCQQLPDSKSTAVADNNTIDRTIRAGMSQVEISEVLGAPKVIQNGARGGERDIEVWLFDVKAKEAVHQKRGGKETLVIKMQAGVVSDAEGTVEVKFDSQGKADSFTYQVKNF